MKSAENTRIIQPYRYVDQTEEEISYPILTREELAAYQSACMALDLGVPHEKREEALRVFIKFYEPHYQATMEYNELCKKVERLTE